MKKINIRFCCAFLIKFLFVLGVLPGMFYFSCQCKPETGYTGANIIVKANSMDRWIDVSWNYNFQPAGGFDIEVSSDGRTFKVAEHAGADDRSTSVYIADNALDYSNRKLYFRVKGLDAAGKPLAMSKVIPVWPAKPRNIEAELREQFNYPETGRPYNFNDPAYTVTYSEAQKQKQRDAAIAMITDLEKAAYAKASPRHFIIPSGIYRVDVGQIMFSDVHDFTIYAPDVQFIIDSEKSGAAFTFDSCSNISLTGRRYQKGKKDRTYDGSFLMFDSQQLPMSMVKILSVDTLKSTFDIEILPGYSTVLPESERMLAYDQAGNMLNIEQMKWINLEPLTARRFRLTSPSVRKPRLLNLIFKPGILLALHNDAQHKNHTHMVYDSRNCRNMTYESIHVVSGAGFPKDHGTAGYTVYRDWRNYPLPGTSRQPITAGLGQFSKNGGTFIFEDCEFGPHLDDGINLLSGMSVLGKQEEPRQIVVTGWQKPTPGSSLTFYDFFNWEKFGERKVTEVKEIEDTAARKLVNAFYASHRMVQNAQKAFRVKLDRDLPLKDFSMVIHSDYRADSIIVRGCLFRDQVAQIMLLQGAKYGLIENNLLLRSTGGGISAQFSQYWWEGPMPSNFFIRNNVIRDNPVYVAVNGFDGNGSIAVYAGTKYPTSERILNNFRIEGNTIINPSVYGISVRNTENVRIRYNRIINPGASEITGTFRGRDIRDLYAAILLDAVSNAEVTDNEIIFGNSRCQRAMLIEPNCDTDSVRVERNTESQLNKSGQ